ncbi:hypothetical protein G6F37_006982 [Rhizopus arrhizus]|nr:hypothetical protein G6F38_005954 [Rhizopus arrhizus]KAG1157131.1 hypothetical protein G6F37_006982 [Rhizopus arrhizus]
MTTPIPDPIAVDGASISAYMKEQKSANLALVKHFAKKSDAVSATFKGLNSSGFTIIYTTPNSKEHEAFIEYNVSIKKAEDVLPVLKAMTKEAEENLGMPNSLTGLPPLKSVKSAAEVQKAQEAEIERLHNHNSSKETKDNALDVFYPADLHWQVLIALGLGTNALLAYASDEFLRENVPSFLFNIRQILTASLIQKIFQGALICHATEGLIALSICLNRNCYSVSNVCKWTLSTTLFGAASMSKLLDQKKRIRSGH